MTDDEFLNKIFSASAPPTQQDLLDLLGQALDLFQARRLQVISKRGDPFLNYRCPLCHCASATPEVTHAATCLFRRMQLARQYAVSEVPKPEEDIYAQLRDLLSDFYDHRGSANVSPKGLRLTSADALRLALRLAEEPIYVSQGAANDAVALKSSLDWFLGVRYCGVPIVSVNAERTVFF